MSGDPYIQKLISSSNKLLDYPLPADFFMEAGKSEPMLEQIGPNEKSLYPLQRYSVEEFIFDSLGHIPLNPSRPGNIQALTDIFEYISDSEELERKKPNYNLKSSVAFLEDLIAGSKIEAQYKRDLQTLELFEIRDRQVFILHGPRGAGKTIYLNHLFAINDNTLDKQKVIWVRVNLLDEFGGTEPPLAHWLLSKLSLIVFRYFDFGSRHCQKQPQFHISLLDKLLEYVDKLSIERVKTSYSENISLMQRTFYSRQELKLDTTHVPLEIALEILKILNSLGYSMIYVIDGIDRLDLTPRFQDKFDHVISELNNLLTVNSLLGGIFLLVMRDESKDDVLERLQYVHNRGCKISFIQREFALSDFEKIIRRRINYVRKEITERIKTGKLPMKDWNQHLTDFEAHLIKQYGGSEFKNYINEIGDYFGCNHRAKVQLLQLSYLDFLRAIRFSKHYSMTESMCKGGLKYPIAPNYSVSKSGVLIHSPERVYDNVFLPNIFHFPYSKIAKSDKEDKKETLILAGLRIMQFLKILQSIKKEEEGRDYVLCLELADVLKNIFDYDDYIIYNLCLLFTEYEIIYMLGNPFKSEQVRNLSMRLLPKARFISERYIYDIAYLNMCAMRTPIISKYLKQEILLHASCLEDIGTDEFASKKVINAINLFRIVSESSGMERSKIEKKLKDHAIVPKNVRILSRARSEGNIFDFYGEKAKSDLMLQVSAIINSLGTLYILEDLINRTWNL